MNGASAFRFSLAKIGELFVSERPVMLKNPELTAYEPEDFYYEDDDFNKLEYSGHSNRSITLDYRLITIQYAPHTHNGLGLYFWRTPAHNALEGANIDYLPMQYLLEMIRKKQLQLTLKQIDTLNMMARMYHRANSFPALFQVKRSLFT